MERQGGGLERVAGKIEKDWVGGRHDLTGRQ